MLLKIIIAALTVIYVNAEITCDPKFDCELPSSPTAVPDPENCRNFFACLEGVPEYFPYTCGEHFHFNGDLTDPQCIDGDCSSPICPSQDIPVCRTSCAELLPAVTGWIAFPGDCASAYYCSPEKGKSLFHCPDGFYFNGIDCSAVSESDACCSVCGVPSCTNELENSFKKLPDKSDCGKFYICFNGIPLKQSCPSGQSFDLLSSECMSTETAFCHSYCKDADDSTIHPETTSDIETSEPEPNAETPETTDAESAAEAAETTDTESTEETPETADTESTGEKSESTEETPETADTESTGEESESDEYEEMDCINVKEFQCPEVGVFPICDGCYPYFLTCVELENELIASESLCIDDGYFNPTDGYYFCMPYVTCSMYM